MTFDWRTKSIDWACRWGVRRYRRWGKQRDLEAALDMFDLLPETCTERVELAVLLIEAIIGAAVSPLDKDLDRVMALVGIVDAAPGRRPPEWAQELAQELGKLALLQKMFRENRDEPPGYSPRSTAYELGKAVIGADTFPDEVTASFELVQLLTRFKAGIGDWDASSRRLLATDLREFTERQRSLRQSEYRRQMVAVAELHAQLIEIADAESRGDFARVEALETEVAALAGRLPEQMYNRSQIADLIAVFEDRLRWSDADPADGAAPDAMVHSGMITTVEAAKWRASRSLRDRRLDHPDTHHLAVRDAEYAVTLADSGGAASWELLEMAGRAYFRRAQALGDESDLRRAVEFYERAAGAAALNPRMNWPTLMGPLSTAYRLLGQPDRARETALNGLRGNTWRALLQNDTEDAHVMVREAAQDAVAAARLLLDADDVEGAARALEAGRGLIVFSAQQGWQIGTRLRESGEEDLALEWEHAVRDHGVRSVPADLRLRVIGTLAGVPVHPDGSLGAGIFEAGTPLLDPPDFAEIKSALSELGWDALVYLVAGDAERTGFALILPTHGAPSVLLLPALESTGSQALEQAVAAMSSRARGDGATSRDLLPEGRPRQDSTVVSEICDWAWQTAVGPLLDHFDHPEERPVRLVMVPMQELALVPWHAARHRVDSRDLYALHHAVFSYTASARMVCDAARRPDVPPGSSGLILADPATGTSLPGLPAARLEAAAIRDAFYPSARLVGRLPDGTAGTEGVGSVDELTAWLADPEGGTMVHFACHGAVHESMDRGETSYLLLHGGARFSAEDMAASLATDSGHEIGLAMLAACSTAKSGRGHDEAFNLGTLLQCQGVRSVISAQWPVPDEETSVLAFMVHHYICEGGLPPADALRCAQLWMLNHQDPPASMPSTLRERHKLSDVYQVASWAGFVHSGR
jgi:CHAT domain